MLMALLNYIDRGAIAYASASIPFPSTVSTRSDRSNVRGYFGYALCHPRRAAVAFLADRFGAKRVADCRGHPTT